MSLKKFVMTSAIVATASFAFAAVINEASISHDFGSDDFPYFIELNGAPYESLDGKSVVLVSQNSTDGVGVIIDTYSLAGQQIGDNGFLVIGNDDAGTTRDLADIFGVTPDVIATVPGALNLGRSAAFLLMNDADIPSAGAGPLAGGESVDDGFDLDGDSRDGAPLAWGGVPVIPPDAGYAVAGFVRNTDGVDTDAAGDITAFQFVTGNVTAPGDITTGSQVATPTAATVASVVINECSISHDFGSSDFPYFFELFGTANESLDGKSLVIISQNTTDGLGSVIDTISLAGLSIGSNGFFLIGNDDAGTVRDVVDIYSGVGSVDATATVPGALNLGRSVVLAIVHDANIPGGAFTGSEPIVDGFDLDGDGRDGAPLAFNGVPVIAADAGYIVAGFVRNADGVDTDSDTDITPFQFVTGNVTTESDITTGSQVATPTGSPATADVSDWLLLD